MPHPSCLLWSAADYETFYKSVGNAVWRELKKTLLSYPGLQICTWGDCLRHMLFITSTSALAQLKFVLREQTLQAAGFGIAPNRLSALTDTVSNSLLWFSLTFSPAAPETSACPPWRGEGKYHTKGGRRGSSLCAQPLYLCILLFKKPTGIICEER